MTFAPPKSIKLTYIMSLGLASPELYPRGGYKMGYRLASHTVNIQYVQGNFDVFI